MKTCSINDCEQKARRRDFCDKHYERWRVHGNPFTVITRTATKESNTKRFLSKVDKADINNCHRWLGNIRKSGYGIFALNGKYVMAHRAAWELFVGPIPQGKMVCHSCDNRSCANIDHLWLGSHIDNMADMVIKKRSSLGENNVKSKLTEEKVAFIRKKIEEGENIAQLAKEFNISTTSMYDIKHKRSWTHI